MARYNRPVPYAIRDFQPGDFDLLWHMDQECFPPGIAYTRQELRLYMRRRGAITIVAVSKNKEAAPAGFLIAHSGPTGHIITIDVAAFARRAGVGSQLLLAAEERLLQSGSSAVALETAVDNLPARAFYERHGYTLIKTWPRYYSNGVDALMLRKELVPVSEKLLP